MRALIQRVSEASVTIDGEIHSKIASGLLILVGIEHADGEEDLVWLCKKIPNLRIFPDDQGVMNRSLLETGGELLVVSQFTLHASSKKGNRPSYIRAAKPEHAVPLYDAFCRELAKQSSRNVMSGEFGADMKIALINDGPVTIWMDSKNKE